MQARPDFESTDKDDRWHPAEEGSRVAGYAAAMQPVAPMQAFDDAGFELLPALLGGDELAGIVVMLEGRVGVGERNLLDEAWCADLAHRLRANAHVAHALPSTHVAVQCTSFEKSIDRNWLVPVHQDLAIPVAARIEHAALGGWSNKGGKWFVQPPSEVLESLVALRLHLDECGVDDGPLNVVAGSHRQGRIDDACAIALRDERGTVTCPVPRGGAMLMRPLLLHASSKATGASQRRVLHFLFGPPHLPFGLAWAGT